MTGQWIWLNDNVSTENERGCFVENLYIKSKDERITLRISADTRYVAYINGEEIGRGPIRSTIDNWYYDEYDITLCLKQGHNLLAVRVWNYGWSTYQSIASNGGLIFDVTQGSKVIAASGKQTKCSRDLGHKYNTVKRNVNLGFTDNYDARKFDCGWIEDEKISGNWGNAKLINDIWGDLKKRPIKPFNTKVKIPYRVVEFAEVNKGCQQVSLNTRKVFFGDRKDANETIFSGFIGCIIDSPKSMDGIIAFPNRTWNGIIGDFKIDGVLYAVNNTHRDINVHLEKGKHFFILQISGKYDDLYCHIEFKFPEQIRFDFIGSLKSRFFVIGPTDRIVPCIDGYSEVYGGLVEFNRMETHTELHRKIFNCKSVSEILEYERYIKGIDDEYVFFDEYIYSLVKNEEYVKRYPITDSLCGILWNNHIPTVIPEPVEGDYNRIIVDFGDIYAGSIEFSLKASAGTVLDIYCFENMFEGKIDYTVGLNNSVRYVCRDGYQRYRCMARMGCRFAAVTIKNQTGNVEIHSFQIRHSTYSSTNIGTFRCSDYLLNKIWDISRQTHLLCMEDSFTDCPTYEQAFWIGDSLISTYINAYIFGEYDFIKHNLKLAVSAYKNTPLMNALTPTDWDTAIPMWMMNWVISVEFYIKITGNTEIITELYPQIRETMTYYSGFINENGAFLINAWNMLDWADMDIHNKGVVTGQQAVLVYCYKVSAGFAGFLGYKADEERFYEISERMLNYINGSLWNDEQKAFYDGWSPEFGYSNTFSIQTHSLLLLFEAITDIKKRQVIEQYLITPPKYFLNAGSPFILFYLYEVWANSGQIKHLLGDIKIRWGDMLRYDSTTCWEVFPGFYEVSRTRSYCHSWSAFPAYFLSKYILGIRIEERGFRKICISVPDTDIEWCEGSIPTPFGMVNIRWSRENGLKSYYISVPCEIDIAADTSFDWKLTVQKLTKKYEKD